MKTEAKKIEPVIKPYEYNSGFIPRRGHYWLVELDAHGTEIKGSDFDIAERTYVKSFKPITKVGDEEYKSQKFMLKKSPTL